MSSKPNPFGWVKMLGLVLNEVGYDYSDFDVNKKRHPTINTDIVLVIFTDIFQYPKCQDKKKDRRKDKQSNNKTAIIS